MTKNELVKRKQELNKELSQIDNQLCDYEYKEKEKLYGDKFHCCFCKYSAVSGLSGDSWHNTCGANNCTCCHDNCEKYQPDNEATRFIKENSKYGYIHEEEYNGFEDLGIPFLKDDTKIDKSIQILKILFMENK